MNSIKNSINDEERRLWVLNDQSLYTWWRDSGVSMRVFIRENRTEITRYIRERVGR